MEGTVHENVDQTANRAVTDLKEYANLAATQDGKVLTVPYVSTLKIIHYKHSIFMMTNHDKNI